VNRYSRRAFLGVSGAAAAFVARSSSTSAASTASRPSSTIGGKTVPGSWVMPAEEAPHQRTWMCWPSSLQVWGADLRDVQDNILTIAATIAEFEPVSMLARPGEVVSVRALLKNVEVIPAPVDDLWARDTLPNFLTSRNSNGSMSLGASHARFNGWGRKQVSSGDTQLAGIVAKRLAVQLVEVGLVGEGGGIEVDGAGTVLAAASSWVNPNRNPGRTRAEVQAALLSMLGARRMIWIDGLAGYDITDGHVDTLARFANPKTIVVDKPAFDDPGDRWAAVAVRTREHVLGAHTAAGGRYKVVEMVQPTTVRRSGEDFLSTYMNYYVCNGGVIAPQFGDRAADAAAKRTLTTLFPGREVIQLDIDGLAAGGGGIHCATQQQPSTSAAR
jgi:agmatine deiminase